MQGGTDERREKRTKVNKLDGKNLINKMKRLTKSNAINKTNN